MDEWLADGLDVRRCPRCNAPMVKNEGCDAMDCYVCGEKFQWSAVPKIKRSIKRVPTSHAGKGIVVRCSY
eukprot:SAG31_NODE_12125_length_966_cov_1.102653_1_plen_69_part_10